MIKHFKQLCTRLVYGADDGSTSLGQRLEQRNALVARSAIQSTEMNKHHTNHTHSNHTHTNHTYTNHTHTYHIHYNQSICIHHYHLFITKINTSQIWRSKVLLGGKAF